MLIAAIQPSHLLVLNKYPVIENHFILATKMFKPQTALLESDDLSVTYACLQAWPKDAPTKQPQRLFAFFNSGEHSGASQAHRHIQFLPVEKMQKDPQNGWELLIDKMRSKLESSSSFRWDPDLPFLHYATELGSDISAHELYSTYISLLRAAVCAARGKAPTADSEKKEPIERNGEVVISYNLAITAETMAIFPRRSESAEVPAADQSLGSVAINGTILGGTLMVKDEHEYRNLKNESSLLDKILTNIGFPVSEDNLLDRTKL